MLPTIFIIHQTSSQSITHYSLYLQISSNVQSKPYTLELTTTWSDGKTQNYT